MNADSIGRRLQAAGSRGQQSQGARVTLLQGGADAPHSTVASRWAGRNEERRLEAAAGSRTII